MRQKLAIALSRFADQLLTVDAARQIMGEVLSDEDRSIPVDKFGEKSWRGYRLRAEHVVGNEADLAPLHVAYHAETRSTFDLNFDYARLREAERAGTVAMFTARTESDELVGVMRVRLGFTLESQHLTACDDLFYIDPAHRGWLAIELWRFAERACFENGVREVTFDSLSVNGAERIAKFLGYTQVAIKFHKVAQDSSDYSTLPTRHAQGVAHVPLAPPRI